MLRILFVILLTLSNYSYSEEYERSEFAHGWKDFDNDCLDTRQEVLLTSSQIPVTLDSKGCKILVGLWYLKFSAQFTTNPSDIDIDHIVPLQYAWTHGANEWADEKRLAFANDMDNLLVTHKSINRSKGSRTPVEWLPPNEQSHCFFVMKWEEIIAKYNLESDIFDEAVIDSTKDKMDCDQHSE